MKLTLHYARVFTCKLDPAGHKHSIQDVCVFLAPLGAQGMLMFVCLFPSCLEIPIFVIHISGLDPQASLPALSHCSLRSLRLLQSERAYNS